MEPFPVADSYATGNATAARIADFDCVVVDSALSPDAVVVWLHGLGADGRDFVPVVPQLGLPDAPGVRFVFPHAPVRSVTVNGGMRMRAWYDILGLEIAARQDERGIRDSAALLEDLLAELQADGFEPGRTVLAGFSQGGAMALHVGLRHGCALAGVMGLSCYLPLHESVESERSEANRATPVFMGHGSQDPVIPVQLGARSRDFLRQHGHEVTWREYPMPHAVCPEEIRDIGRWLAGVLEQESGAE